MASVPMKTFTTVTLAVFASHFPGFTSAAALGNLGDPIRSVTGPMHATALSGPQCCFADNCLTWTLDDSGRILHGTCYDKRDQRGHWPEVSSSLDLSNCVGNFNGVLLPASAGAYSKSCEDCALQGTVLTCKCKTPSGSPGLKATVDLNAFVQDYNGRLKCFNYDATTSNIGD
ncbi:Cyanovirin-N [Coniochaeta sp. PMI_546]|nr:Cyanovirin-N [Coniochaeta sp. PMI_546]